MGSQCSRSVEKTRPGHRNQVEVQPQESKQEVRQKALTFIRRVSQNSTLFEKLGEMFTSKSFTIYAANELCRAYCVLEGCPFEEISEHQKDKIACSWASIPAADAVAHQMAFMRRTERVAQQRDIGNIESPVSMQRTTDFLKSSNAFDTSESDYMQALRLLTSPHNISKTQIYLCVNCAHLAYRAGLPFRDMGTTDFTALRSPERNKPFTTIRALDREKSFSLICKAAQLILRYLHIVDEDLANRAAVSSSAANSAFDVFLGGSCNPTTWRADTAIPALVKGECTYYNPQVDEWTPDLIHIESMAKASAAVLVFVIDDQTRALASMLEVSECIASGRTVLLCVKLVEAGAVMQGVPVEPAEVKDLNRARQYLMECAERHNVRVFKHERELMEECVKVVQAERKRQVAQVVHDPKPQLELELAEDEAAAEAVHAAARAAGKAAASATSRVDTTAEEEAAAGAEAAAALAAPRKASATGAAAVAAGVETAEVAEAASVRRRQSARNQLSRLPSSYTSALTPTAAFQ